MNKRLKIIFAAGLLLGVGLATSGCATSGSKNIQEVTVTPPADGYKPSPHYGNVSTPMNPSVQKWINYFTGRGRKHMQVYLERSSRYIPMMKGVFRERGMPDELAYIALIESGFSPTAFSHASAVGYWQFIRGTGLRYNLKIDPYTDERRDPILSTQAAANYLDTLYGMFGDWHLAIASYNAGENRIAGAVRKTRNRNFWEIAAMRRALPRETQNYIPKYVAAVYIASNPEAYGFTNIDFQPEFEFESIVIQKPVSLELLAEALGIKYEDLKRMNPRYKSDYVPVYTDRENAVRVPVGRTADALAMIERAYSEAPRRYIASFEYYKVRRGDTLSGIARKFRTSIARIRDLNDWAGRKTMIRIGQKIKVPDGMPMQAIERETKKEKSSRAPAAKKESNNIQVRYHRVEKGETLLGIAHRNNLTMSELIKLNKMANRKHVRIGEKLLVSKKFLSSDEVERLARSSDAPASKKIARNTSKAKSSKRVSRVAGASRATASKKHTVRRGENLTTIARQYNVSVGEITKANALNTRAKLFVGKSIIIPD
ncbi:MAG: LysM peptidoglycan-binding domain-containing protein [Bdellovibrionota bacterium]